MAVIDFRMVKYLREEFTKNTSFTRTILYFIQELLVAMDNNGNTIEGLCFVTFVILAWARLTWKMQSTLNLRRWSTISRNMAMRLSYFPTVSKLLLSTLSGRWLQVRTIIDRYIVTFIRYCQLGLYALSEEFNIWAN